MTNKKNPSRSSKLSSLNCQVQTLARGANMVAALWEELGLARFEDLPTTPNEAPFSPVEEPAHLQAAAPSSAYEQLPASESSGPTSPVFSASSTSSATNSDSMYSSDSPSSPNYPPLPDKPFPLTDNSRSCMQDRTFDQDQNKVGDEAGLADSGSDSASWNSETVTNADASFSAGQFTESDPTEDRGNRQNRIDLEEANQVAEAIRTDSTVARLFLAMLRDAVAGGDVTFSHNRWHYVPRKSGH